MFIRVINAAKSNAQLQANLPELTKQKNGLPQVTVFVYHVRKVTWF
jgi:hypothetical protein